MKKISLISLLAPAFLVGCSDGVPNIDNPHKIVVDGKYMTQQEFMTKYCRGKLANETCLVVSKATSQDVTKGKMPSGW